MFERSAKHQSTVPNHVAIIMDGNGRWAAKRMLPRVFGHREGVKVFKRIVRQCADLQVRILTVYAFSTENQGRPPDEVSFLMDLMEKTFRTEIDELCREGVRVCLLGDRQGFSKRVKELWESAEEQTRGGNRLTLNVAFNYGGRREIVDAARRLARRVHNGELDADCLSEELFANNLYTSNLADPDLVIRTGGEFRMSNFLLWQAAYAEWYFTDVLWPDFSDEHLLEAFAEYERRERRFGRISEDRG